MSILVKCTKCALLDLMPDIAKDIMNYGVILASCIME